MSMTSRFSTAICTHGRNDLRGEVKPEVAEVQRGQDSAWTAGRW
jgi:hypothetical protein